MDPDKQILEVYDKYADAIFRHCYFRVHDRDLAIDLTQETFVRTWEYLRQGKEVDNLRAFLYRVASNLIVDFSRKKKSQSLDNMQDKGLEIRHIDRETTEGRLDAKGVVLVLDKLNDNHRTVIVMRYLDELSVKEIAQALGESENAISVRIHRALKKLRDHLEEDHEL